VPTAHASVQLYFWACKPLKNHPKCLPGLENRPVKNSPAGYIVSKMLGTLYSPHSFVAIPEITRRTIEPKRRELMSIENHLRENHFRRPTGVALLKPAGSIRITIHARSEVRLLSLRRQPVSPTARDNPRPKSGRYLIGVAKGKEKKR
jgi:hypothetical protein